MKSKILVTRSKSFSADLPTSLLITWQAGTRSPLTENECKTTLLDVAALLERAEALVGFCLSFCIPDLKVGAIATSFRTWTKNARNNFRGFNPFMKTIVLISFFPILHTHVVAQQSTVYASVVSTKLFVVGAANPNTGLYYQRPGDDTTWQHTGASRIRAFGVATDLSSKGQIIYIASGNGLHRTTDGGKTWRITTGWETTEVLWVTPDQRNRDVVYIATAYGIYKTTDGCATWKEMNNGLATPSFTPCVIIGHSDPNTLYCASEDGVYVSHDAALTWKRTGFHARNVRVVVQHPNDPKTLFVGTEDNGIYVTHNDGKWWAKTEAGIDHTTFYTITFDPTHPDTMYAGGYVSGVYKSVDGGMSWKRKSNGLEYQTIHSIAVDPTNSGCVYAGTIFGGIYRTENGGESWKSAGLPGAQVYTIIIQPY